MLISHQEPALLDEAYPIVIEITNTDDRTLVVVVDVLLQPTEVDEAGASPPPAKFYPDVPSLTAPAPIDSTIHHV